MRRRSAADRCADVPDAEVVREYLAEVTTMIGTSAALLYSRTSTLRPGAGRPAGRIPQRRLEEEHRTALRALGGSGGALEINISGCLPLDTSPLNLVTRGGWHDGELWQQRT